MRYTVNEPIYKTLLISHPNQIYENIKKIINKLTKNVNQ